MESYPQIEIADAPTELVDMDSIQHHPDNPRYHSRQQIEELAASLKDHGYAGITLTISKDTRNIVKGNGMYDALMLCGCKKVRVVIKEMTPLEELQFLIRDNRLSELSRWDLPVLQANLATLGDEGVELENVGFELKEIEAFGERRIDPDEEKAMYDDFQGREADNQLWEGMPDFENEDNQSYQKILVHFKTAEDVLAFSELIGQDIRPETKYIYFPKQENFSNKEFSYA